MAEPVVIACNLAALNPAERELRATLAARVAARFREVQETPDGYAARLDDDPALMKDALDWLLLERRCCPFLQLTLALEPSDGPVWLRFEGGPGVKGFLAAAGFTAASRRQR